jgi:SAM-dependent methyltransferase
MNREMYLFHNRGTKYLCPFCGYRSDILLPFGHSSEAFDKYHIIGGGKRNVSCLKCNSHDRERLIYVYLKFVYKLFDKKRISIFHVAPEPRISKELLKHSNIDYVCGDLFAEGYEYPSYVQNMNILDLSFEDNRFDIVLCNHVLEHIEDDRTAMKELLRILKPDGFAILQVPISNVIDKTIENFTITDTQERLRLFGQKDHCRLYGKDYVQRLENVGFKVEKVSIAAQYSKYAVNPEEQLFICKKQ